MSFYEKLSLLPHEWQEPWETFLLRTYTLQKATQMLDYLVDSDTWLPRIFGMISVACKELKVALVPEVIEQLRMADIETDGRFIMAISSFIGSRFGINYYDTFEIEACCLYLHDESELWISTTESLLASSNLVTLEMLIGCLDLAPLLRHGDALNAFEEALAEAGIWTHGEPSISTINRHKDIDNPFDFANVDDNNVLETRQYRGEFYMDLYYDVLKDPSMHLDSHWDSFFFNEQYLKRLFEALVLQMKTNGLSVIKCDECPRLLTVAWNIEYPKRYEFLEGFLWEVCTTDGFGGFIDSGTIRETAGLKRRGTQLILPTAHKR